MLLFPSPHASALVDDFGASSNSYIDQFDHYCIESLRQSSLFQLNNTLFCTPLLAITSPLRCEFHCSSSANFVNFTVPRPLISLIQQLS